MNYFGRFDATVSDALGKHPGGHLFSETVHASHAPSDAIVVPDAQLLFGGEFKRAGVDLVLSGDGREFVLHDYFKGEKHAPLASPDGAHLTGDLVNALAGQVQIAQAGGNAAAGQVIGHVTKLAGTATAIRNGVSIILNNGDNVEKGDVVASGSDSTVGITFIDGTVFGLSSNARMVLNEMVYDPNGSNNSSLLSLVAGTITFVAGETAKHGDMKVDTPVATMGIRGTAVLVEIDFSVPGTTPDAKFQVLVEPDGTTGSYILFDKTTLTPLAVVDKAGMQINVSNGVMSQTLAPLSPEIQKLITDVFSLKFSDSTNTKAIEHFTDSIVPNAFGPVQFALANGNVVTFSAPPPVPTTSSAAAPSPATIGHIPQAPNFFGEEIGKITEAPHVTNSTALDTATGQFQYFDINTSDHDTVSVKFSSFTYQNAKGNDVTGSLSSLQLADIAKVEAAITVSDNTGPNAIGNGIANWTYSVSDKAFDFLAAGETLTLTYTATVDNNYQPLDQTGTATITITITGTNDAPVITSPQQNVSFVSSGADTKGGELIPNTATQGTLNFTDPDLTDTHTVAVKMASALLDGKPLADTAGQTVINELAAAVTVSLSNGGQDSTGSGAGTIAWTLANLQVYLADLVPNGESLVLTYAVTVTDSQGATSVQDIVVTIGGNEGAAVVWVNVNPIPAGGVALWSTASNWEGDRAPSILGTDDVIIGTDQVLPGTPVFPATVNDAEAAKSLTMDYFTDFGTSIPELDVLSTGNLTIVGALNMDTSTDAGSPLTAESIIKNFGTISVGGIATLLKNSVLDNYGTITLAKGGVFADQSSITNSGTIEVVSGTLDVEVGIANFVATTVDDSPVTTPGTIQVDGGATLKFSDGATVTNGEVTLGNLSVLDVERGAASLPAGTPDATLDGVTVIGTSGPTGSTIEIGTLGAATLLLDDGTAIKNGDLTISAGSALDVTASGATLDGVNVTGSNGSSGGAGAMLGGLEAHAGVLVSASTIEVGTTATTGTVLTLDDGTTITNGNLIIDSGNTLEIDKGAASLPAGAPDATLDGVSVTNSGAIQIDSSATLTLEGGTTINGGTIDDAGTLSVGALSEIENTTINGGGDLTVTSGTLTLSEVTLDDVTLAGSFTNSDTLTIDETVTLNGATINGGAIDDTGTLLVSFSSEIENATVNGGGDLTVTSGTLTLSEVTLDDVTPAGSFTNLDTLTIDETVTLKGATISGGTIDDTGTLSVSASSEIENATVNGGGGITVTGGTLTLSEVTLDDVTLAGSFTNSDTLMIDETVTLNGATISGGTIDDTGTLSVSTASTIENAIVDGGGNLTATSAVLTLSGVTLDNVTLGGLFTNSGTLTIDGTVTFSGELTGGTIDDTGTLSVTTGVIGGATIEGGGDLTSTSAAVSLAGVTLEDVTVAGIFADASTVKIEETVTLDGATIKGGTIDDAGTLSVSTASTIENAIVDGGGNLTATGATLTLSVVLLDDVTLAGSFANLDTLTIEGPVTLDDATISGGTIEDAGGSLTGTGSIGSVIAGPGAVTASGGTLTLTGDDTYVGATTIDNGATLALSGAGSISDSIDVVDNGTFDISGLTGDTSIVTLSGDGTVNLGANTLTLLGASTTFSGAIGGTGGLTLTSGTETLAGDNGYTGVTTIDDGAQLTLTGSISDSSNVVDDGTLDISGTSGASIVTLSGDGTVNLGAETLTLTDPSTTFSGAIDGTGGLTVDVITVGGTATETLTGDNLYSGVTTIDSGDTLALSDLGSIAKSSDVIDDGIFDISATTLGASIVTLSGTGAGAVKLGAESLTLTNASTTFNGAIGGTGGLTLAAGTETLTGTNTFGGETTIDNGAKLALSGTGSISDSSDVVDNGTFDISGLTAGTSIETLSGDGAVNLGANTLTLLDASTTFGGTINGTGELEVAGGTLTFASATLDGGTLVGSFSNSGTLTINNTVTLDSAAITGGSIDVVGDLDTTGTSSISGASITNLGNIHIISGTLDIDPTPFTNLGLFDVQSSVTFSDELFTNSGTVNNVPTNGTLQIEQNGTLTLENSSITGGIVSNSGIVDVTAASSISDTFSFTNAGTVNADGAELDLVGDIVGNSGGLFKTTGNGVLDLMNTTINQGTLKGKIATATGNTSSSTLNGVTLAFGTLVTAAFGLLELTGTISNSGEVDATLGALDLYDATVDGGTFGGHGTIITASGNSDSVLNGVTIASGSTVTAAVGTLDLTGLTTNNGEIDATTGTLHLHNATVIGGTLGGASTITTDSLNQFSILKNVTIAAVTKVSASTGVLELTGAINNHGEIDATTGTIELINADVIGGTLGGDGTITTASAFNTLDGVTIASGTTVEVADGTVLDLIGTITDVGTIALDASGHFTGLEISGNVSLTGGGNVTMNSDFYSFIASDGSAAKLSNFDTISGAGTIGDSHLMLSNSGTIDATGSHALVIDTGANFFTSTGLVGNLLVTNNVGGVLESSSGHTLQIDDNVFNNGLIQSGNPGSHSGAFVDVTGNISGTGSIDIFNNSTVEIGGSVSQGETVTFGAPGGSVVPDGTLTLDDSKDFHGTIVGLAAGDVIGLTDLAYTSNEHAVWTQTTTANGGSGTLQIYDGLGTLESTLDLTGTYTQNQFSLVKDESHGTDVHINNYVSFDEGTINTNGAYTPQISNAGNTIELTNGTLVEASSWFDNSVYSISEFTASFDYSATGGSNPADGMAFILQNSSDGVHALGGAGSLFGYGAGALGDAAGGDSTGISPSAAIEFNLYALYGQGTAFATDGGVGNYTPTGSVAFASGDQVQADISYNGSVLTETLTDLVTGATYSANYTVDLSSVLGSDTAYVGFSAATGGSVATQIISNFAFSPGVSGDVTIDSHQMLEISAASSATVDFTNSSGNTGELVLDDSNDFSGAIVGFAGDGTKANSDLIDVTDVNFADVALNKTTYTDQGNGTGTLTLHDANGHALDSINFDGNYQLANFTVASDGNGGTLIVDPPVNTNAQTPANTTVVSNQNSTGSAGTDGFVFNFDGHHDTLTTDFHPDQENGKPVGAMLTNLHTGSNGAPDQGTPVGGDGHDPVGLSAFAKAHLHAADFHFV